MAGEHRIMIATKAFGLGIDKPDIRFILHFEFPDSVESYAQEAGRAGRDGLAARAALLYRLEDKRIQSYFLGGRYPRLDEFRSLVDVMTSPATADTLAEASQLGKRRTQVLLQILQDAKVAKRTRSGYTLLPKEPLRDEELQYLLNETEARSTRDKERLAEMMHYAETAGCRTQFLRTYFGEPAGAPCQRCDNCERGLETGADLQETPQAQGTTRNKQTSVPDQQPEQEASPQPVTIVPTRYGEIHTTAPETLPAQPDKDALLAGDRIRHQRFGLGYVLDVHGNNALVRFTKHGEKRIAITFLRKA